MAQFAPHPDGFDADDLIEQLGAALASRYAEVEDELIQQVAKRAYRDLQLQVEMAARPDRAATLADYARANRKFAELQAYRAQALRDLQFAAMAAVERIRADGLAQQVVAIAASEGEAAASAALRQARRLPIEAGATGSATQAVGALVVDLESRLEAMNSRITRYPQDAYQRIISFTAPMQLAGGQTPLVAQQQAVRRFLAEGITGFVDKAERRWRIGSYAEMAGRTAVARAHEDATIWRLGQSGMHLGQITGGFDPCKHCAPWIGKIVSLDGSEPGPRLVPSAVADATTTVFVDATIEQARATKWGHPNCRDRVVGYLPGISVKQSAVEYSEARDKERQRHRALERRVRAAKRDAATAPDEMARRRAERDVRDAQADLREFARETGRQRQSYREQLHFADGRT